MDGMCWYPLPVAFSLLDMADKIDSAEPTSSQNRNTVRDKTVGASPIFDQFTDFIKAHTRLRRFRPHHNSQAAFHHPD